MPAPELDPDVLATLRALNAHRVEHIVVGAAADRLHGNAAGSYVDALAIVPSGYARNVERLSALLSELEAELRVPGESQSLPVDVSPANLRELGRCTFATELADVAVDFAPPGTAGYPDLYADARRVELQGGVGAQLASAEDLDRIEGASGRSRRPGSPAGRAGPKSPYTVSRR